MTTASNLKPLPESVTRSWAWRWLNSSIGQRVTFFNWDVERAWRRLRFFFRHCADCDTCGYPSPTIEMTVGRYGMECRGCAEMGAMVRAVFRRHPDAFAVRESRTPDTSTNTEATQ